MFYKSLWHKSNIYYLCKNCIHKDSIVITYKSMLWYYSKHTKHTQIKRQVLIQNSFRPMIAHIRYVKVYEIICSTSTMIW
jgi:hypothetical protein